jgi:hypothetical protein
MSSKALKTVCIALVVLALSVLPLSASAQAASAPDGGDLSVRLADMEHRVGVLREEVGRSHAHLALLMPDARESMGARVRITHTDAMPPTYRLVRVAFALDGARIFLRADPAGVDADAGLEIFDGSMPAGEHVLTTELEYVGDGLGLFPYLEGYRFRVRSSHHLHAEPGERLDVGVVGYERDAPLADVSDRPAVRYLDEATRLGDRAE